MKVKIPSVVNEKKYNEKFRRTINTTTDFGFLQPLICRELSARDTLNFAVGHEVQFAPMPAPTFGQVDLKAYHCFVPIESIYHPYGSLMKGEVYRGSNETYIPQTVITTSNAQLFTIGKILSTITLYTLSDFQLSDIAAVYQNRVLLPSDEEGFNETLTVYLNKLDGNFSTGEGELQASFCPTIYGIQAYAKDYFAGYDSTDRDDLKYYDWYEVFEEEYEGETFTYLVCGKYSHAGRNWRTICQGLGYKFNNSGTEQTFLKLLAWYKAYYELFYPKRDLTWKATYAAGIQEWCEQYGVFDLLDGQSFLKYDLLGNFVKDVVRSYYCGNPDWISAHITGMSTQTAAQNNDSIDYLTAVGGSSTVGTGAANSQARLTGGNTSVLTNMLTKSALDLLDALSARINVRTALGGRICEYLKSQLGSEYFDEDKYMSIGADSMPMFVEKIMNQAQTAEGDLGEFAGRGQSEGNGENYTFTAPEVGYWITMVTVVPRGHYCQGVDRDCGHISKYDFFDKKFDSLTLVPTRKMYIYGEQEFTPVSNSDGGINASFGNIPNYSEYCTVNDLINGDIARPSTRASFLAYTMQKLLPYTAVDQGKVGTKRYGRISNLDMSVVVNGIIWRFINLVPWLGIFNRMFTNSGSPLNVLSADVINANENYTFWHTPGQDDNFILNAIINFTLDSLKLPLQDSFQTEGFDSNFTVEKS